MRASVASISKKFVSTFFAATLALGLVPAAAFAAEDAMEDGADSSVVSSGVDGDGANEEPVSTEESEAIAEPSNGTETPEAALGSSTAAIPAGEIINQAMPLEVVAKAESTRSYFLAKTLESTRTLPMVSANLPIDTAVVDESVAPVESDGVAAEEGDQGSDEPDQGGIIAAESTVVGSFEYRGITYAVEPGGESVALVAVDYSKLSEDCIQNQIIIIPGVITSDDIDFYSVTRIADDAFSSLKRESGDPAYVGCASLFADKEVIAGTGIGSTEAEALLNSDGEMADIDGAASFDTIADPLKDCAGILVLDIPASVKTIEPDAFAGFETLQYLIVSEENPEYASFDGALYSADLTQLRLIPEGRVGAVWVAPSATTVDPEVFSHCPLVDTVVADPDGREAFDGRENPFEDSGIEVIYATDASAPSSLVVLLEAFISQRLSLDASVLSSSLRATYAGDKTYSLRTDIDVPYTVTVGANSGAPAVAESSYVGKTFSNSTPYSLSGVDHWWLYSNVGHWMSCVQIACGTASTGSRYDVELTPVSSGYTITAGYESATSANRAPTNKQYYSNPIHCKVIGKSYKITFNTSGGSTTEASKTVTYNAAVPNVAIPKRTGYKFTGYYESVDSNSEGVGDAWFNDAGVFVKQKTSVDYTGEKAGARWGVAGTKTLYAGWTPTKTFSFDYDINYKVNATAVRGAPALNASVNTTVYNNSKPFSLAGITQWIRYNGNRPDWLTMAYGGGWSGKAYDVVVTPVCSGYSASLGFLSADATSYEWGGREDAIVYCKAIGNPYKVTFSPGAGATTEASKNVTYNAAVSDVAIPTREGYTFTGYYESVDANGKGIGDAWFNDVGVYVKQKTSVDYTGEKAGARWGTADNKILYAGWKAKTYTIHFNDLGFEDAHWQDGENLDRFKSVEYDADVKFPTPVKAGWICTSWVRIDEPDGEAYKPGQTINNANFESEQGAIAEFQARWKENIKVSVPVGSQSVNMAISADFADGKEFNVDKGVAAIENLCDGELKVVSVREDVSDEQDLNGRKASAANMFDARGHGSSILEASAVSFVLAPLSDNEEGIDESKKKIEFALFGGCDLDEVEGADWILRASDGLDNGATPSKLRILYDMAFDYRTVDITDLKINLSVERFAKLIYTFELHDKTQPVYKTDVEV